MRKCKIWLKANKKDFHFDLALSSHGKRIKLDQIWICEMEKKSKKETDKQNKKINNNKYVFLRYERRKN